MTLEFEISRKKLAERKKIAEDLGVSMDTMLLLCLEHILLRLYSKLDNPWPEAFFGSTEDIDTGEETT